jgi:hypothetical protein
LRTISGEASTTTASTEGTSTTEGGGPDLDAPADELMEAVRTIMEASQRGELTEQETDDKLREVVESIVGDQVEAGRRIGESLDEGESAEPRERPEEEADESTEVKRPRENIGR